MTERWERRDQKRRKKRWGMVVDGQGIKTVLQHLARKSKPKKRKKKRKKHR